MKEPDVVETMQSTEYQLPVKVQVAGHDLIFGQTNQNPLAQLYQSPYGEPGAALDGLLRQVEGLMKENGISISNLRPGMLAFLVPIALKLGYPFAVMFSGKGSTAAADHLLSTCMRFAPKEWFVDISNLKADQLYGSGGSFSDKVLVCRNPVTVKKIESDLLNLIVNGCSTRQALSKSQFGSETREYHVKGPVGFIGIETEAGCGMFNHPAILRLTVADNHGGGQTGHDSMVLSSGQSYKSVDFEFDRLIEYIKRFERKKVMIPYLPILLDTILQCQPSNYRVKTNIIKKVISVCTILNHPPQISAAQLMAKLYGSRAEAVEDWLSGSMKMPVRTVQEPELQSGGIEYRIVKNLLDGLIPNRDALLSELEVQLFEVVKMINLSALQSSMIDSGDFLEQLYQLNKGEFYRAKIETIFKFINRGKNFSQIIPLKDVETELAVLKKRGFVERKKFKDREEHGYFITVFEIAGGLELPNEIEVFPEKQKILVE